MASNTITISKDEYQELKNKTIWVEALEAAGVDNWDGIDFAREIFIEMGGESEDD